MRKIVSNTAKYGLMSAIVLATATTAASAQEIDDATIVGIYSQVNSFDIETALLGELKGESQLVRQLGQMVSRDHSGVRKAVHTLAVEQGIEPILPPARLDAARQHDEVIAYLRGLEGEAFDEAYLKHEISFHRAAIKAVEDVLLPEADDEELRAHFEAILPAFRHHLQANIDAAETLEINVDN